MEDLETLPKRRKLNEPGDVSCGLGGNGAPSLVSETKVENVNAGQKPGHDDKMTWNFKRIDPELPKCSEKIVESTGTADRKESDGTNAPHQENALTLSKMELRENTQAPKRRLKIVHAHNTQERSSGNTLDSPIAAEQYFHEGLFSGPLTEENMRDVIKKLIKDHTREALNNAEILRDKISALETENKRLKHRVVVLFRALKEVVCRQRTQEVLPTTAQTTSMQKKPHVKPNNIGLVQALPADACAPSLSPTHNFCKKDIFKTRELSNDVISYDSLTSVTDGAGSFHQRVKSTTTTVVTGLHQLASRDATSPRIPNRIPNTHTSSLGGLALNFPTMSICEEKAVSLGHLPAISTTSCTNRIKHSLETVANKGCCTVTTFSTKAVMVSSCNDSTKAIKNTVPLLSHIVNEAVPITVTPMQDQPHIIRGLQIPKESNNLEESQHCSKAGIDQVFPTVFTHSGSRLTSPLLEQTTKSDSCNECSPQRHGVRLVNQQFKDTKRSEAESKQGDEWKNTWNTKIDGLKEISGPFNGLHKNNFFPGNLPRVSQECCKSDLCTESPKTGCNTSQQLPSTDSKFPFVVAIPISIPGFDDRKSIPVKDAGSGNTISPPKLSEVTSTSVFIPTPHRILPNGSIEVKRPNPSWYFVNHDRVNNEKRALHQIPYILETPSSKLQQDLPSKSSAAVSNPYCRRSTHGQVFFNRIVGADGTKTVSSPLKLSAHEEEKYNSGIILPKYENGIRNSSRSDQRTFPHLERAAISQVTESFPNKMLTVFTSVNTSKAQEALSSTNPGNVHNLHSSGKTYNGRECDQHTRKPSESSPGIRYHVPFKPTFFPYSTKGTKAEQQVPLMGYNERFALPVTELQAPNPHVLAQIPQFLNAEAKFARNQYSISPMRQQIETMQRSGRESISDPARLFSLPENSSRSEKCTDNCFGGTRMPPSFDKERLLLQLLESSRASFIPQRAPRTCKKVLSTDKQDLFSSQSENPVPQSSYNSEISNRYVHLQPQNHIEDRLKKLARPSLLDSSKGKTESAVLPGNPSSDVEGFKERSWETKCSKAAQLELSSSCQRYLNQLKNSTGLPTVCHQNTVNSNAKPTPHLESWEINMNESLRAFPFPSPGSLMTPKTSQQHETCSEQQVNLKSPNVQKSRENDNHKLQKPLCVFNHDKKFISPHQQQVRVCEQQQFPHIKNSSVTKEQTQHPKQSYL